MRRLRKIRFIEPCARPGRPFNPWIKRWPLLGPITLATILDARGYDVAVYNENISGPISRDPAAYSDFCSADVVGISIMTPTAMRGYEIAHEIRRDAPEVRIVFGGVHATFLPHEALEHGDVVVRGEGENVIEAIARGDVTEGIVDSPPLEDLDSIPALKHELMWDFEKLLFQFRQRRYYQLPVMTSRGCPHGCTFCSVTRMFGRKVRRQSVGKVYSDLCDYAAKGYRHFFFYDDNFTTNRAWTTELLERMEPLRVRFNAQARVDFAWVDRERTRVDRPLLDAMKRSGGDVLYIGYETIDERTAAEWGKGYAGAKSLTERLGEDTKMLHDSGFWIHAMFVLGPQHTKSDADGIVRFARRNAIESLQVSILTPFPGTPLFNEMSPHLIFKQFPRDWDFYDGGHCIYDNSRLGFGGLQKAVLNAHHKFYHWGGLSLRRVRALLAGRLPMRDKVSALLSQVRIAETVLRQWREETKRFIELATERKLRGGIQQARL